MASPVLDTKAVIARQSLRVGINGAIQTEFFDSTRGPIGVGVTHLKVSDSVLSDDIGSGTTLFIPLLSFLGRATVDAVAENGLKAN